MGDPVAKYEHFDVYLEPKVAGRKTPSYRLINRTAQTSLGVVEWYGPWRQFCFFPSCDSVWSGSCLEAVRDFILKAKRDYLKAKKLAAAGIEDSDGG